MNSNETNSVEEIIDLTDVVSVGITGENNETPRMEDDVLDSLVNDFEKNIGAVSAPAANVESSESEESDEPLDLGKLDSLINSYNLDFDADNNQDENNEEIDPGMEVAFVEDDKPNFQANFEDENSFIPHSQKNSPEKTLDAPDIDDKDIPSFEDIDLPSLEDEQDSEIDLLTKDIIDGTNTEKNTDIQENINSDAPQAGGDDPFSAMLNEELVQQNMSSPKPQAAPAQAAPINAEKPEMSPLDNPEEEALKSDMADEGAEEINEDVLNGILNELSLEHEAGEEVVPFAKEAPSEAKPIHLKGDVSFIEAGGKEKSEDIHLVQSASKVLASGEAYLEKFSGEKDDSVGAKIKNLSTKMFSLEQRLIAADSKVQDSMLELNYRINGLETKFSEAQDVVKTEILAIKSESANALAEEKSEQENAESSAAVTDLADKVQALEKRVATLDDIFSEQKMLNDELSKNLDSLMQNAGAQGAGSDQTAALEEKIAVLEGQLAEAQAKIAGLEENLEKAASLAAAKVLREEIIPLLGQ